MEMNPSRMPTSEELPMTPEDPGESLESPSPPLKMHGGVAMFDQQYHEYMWR
jgi:hypothetical protein